MKQKRRKDNSPNGEDPCNPLFWYPKKIPDYCYSETTPSPPDKRPGDGFPVPIPVPVVPPPAPPFHLSLPPRLEMPPVPMAAPPSAPAPPGLQGPMMAVPQQSAPVSVPIPIQPIPYGIPLAPTHPMLPVFPQMYPYAPSPFPAFPSFPTYPIPPIYQQGPPIGYVPGAPGLVSADGGINILPFTDVYTEMLEKHKEKLMQKKIERMMEKYEGKGKRKPYRRRMYYD